MIIGGNPPLRGDGYQKEVVIVAIDVQQTLAYAGAVFRGLHFGLTSGNHSRDYVNVRAVIPRPPTKAELAAALVEPYIGKFDVVLGPETGGRSLAEAVGDYMWYVHGQEVSVVWADIEGQGEEKVASFNDKFGFVELMKGKRILIVDDLLSTGSTELAVLRALEALGIEYVIVALAVVVNRKPDLTEDDLGVPDLHVLTVFGDLEQWTPEDCKISGPCSEQRPMVVDLGRGKEWFEENPNYAGGSTHAMD